MARQKRDNRGRLGATTKLRYELMMLLGTLNKLRDGGPSLKLQDPVLYNALLHSFLLAVRNLHVFLYSTKEPHQGDIIAEDLFDDSNTWTTGRPGSRDQDLLDLINRRLCHLTWDRVFLEKPGWHCEPIAQTLASALERFVELANEGDLDDEFKKLVRTFRG